MQAFQGNFSRIEHWIAGKGMAKIIKGNYVIALSKNQSTFMSLGKVYCLANPGLALLEIIEVQSVSYISVDKDYVH